MPLDGLRAWIGEVERKLGMRTRVFLVLATIAIGGAGAAIYLAIDTRDNSVSESDVQELQERLEGQSGTGTAGGGNTAQLEAELNALEAEVERLRGDGGTAQQGNGSGTNDSGTGSGGGAGGGGGESAGTNESGNAAGGSGTGVGGGGKAGLRGLVEQAEQNAAENAK